MSDIQSIVIAIGGGGGVVSGCGGGVHCGGGIGWGVGLGFGGLGGWGRRGVGDFGVLGDGFGFAVALFYLAELWVHSSYSLEFYGSCICGLVNALKIPVLFLFLRQ